MMIDVWWGRSGVHWDNKTGCTVGPELEEVWAAHIALRVRIFHDCQILTTNIHDT